METGLRSQTGEREFASQNGRTSKIQNVDRFLKATDSKIAQENLQSILFSFASANQVHGRRVRKAAREARAMAEKTMARARQLRLHVHRLDPEVEDASTAVKRQRTLRDESLDALKQSLRDL